MTPIRQIERRLVPCPEVDTGAYPADPMLMNENSKIWSSLIFSGASVKMSSCVFCTSGQPSSCAEAAIGIANMAAKRIK